MPDKHEVGGSSPLGPTIELRRVKNPIKKRKRLFSERSEEIRF